MANESKVTTDHDTIIKWAEEREGKPAIVKPTKSSDEGAGILRINFPGYKEENLENISWEKFFETFDERDLAMVYQEETKDGQTSRFNKFVKQGSEN